MISIIIPTLNEEKYLPLLLESLKKQSFGDYEIIMADAGSQDATLEIAKKYGARVVMGGLPGPGRNSGARVAKGDILLFLDADVVLPEGFLARAAAEFKRKNLGLAGFPIGIISQNAFERYVNVFANIAGRLTWRVSPHACVATMVTKKLHQSIGGFDESILLLEDICYAKAAAKAGKAGYINDKVFTSDRRFQKEGLGLYGKYFLAELYTFFIGPIRSDIFHYKFNHYKDKK
jgi:glycosyltransferase involved in cell wall biosynthesis